MNLQVGFHGHFGASEFGRRAGGAQSVFGVGTEGLGFGA